MIGEIMVNKGTIIAAITETHLHAEMLEAEVQIKGYQIFRSDRVERTQGGVAIYVRDDIAANSSVISAGSNGVVEHIVLHLKQLNLIVACIYRPPQSPVTDIQPALREVKEAYMSHEIGNSLVLCGDFNLPKVDWKSQAMESSNLNDSRTSKLMFDLMEELFLEQLIEVPTRVDNILDLEYF